MTGTIARPTIASLKTPPIGLRLALALALPVIGILVPGFGLISEAQTEGTRMHQAARMIEYAIEAGGLVHELQKERGMSATFIASEGTQMAEALTAQSARAADLTQRLHASFDRLTGAGLTASSVAAIQRGLEETAALELPRPEIAARRVDGAGATAPFTAAIARLLAIVPETLSHTANPKLSRMLIAYHGFLATKESAGQERAAGASSFGGGHFNLARFETWVAAAAAQRAYLAIFDTFAPADMSERAHATVTGPVVEKLEAMRIAIRSAGPGAPVPVVTGTDWFQTATARIDLMKRAENDIAARIGQTIAAEAADARQEMYATIAGMLFLAGATILTGWRLVRGVTRPLLDIQGSVLRLAEGDHDQEIPRTARGDEIGAIARAVATPRDQGNPRSRTGTSRTAQPASHQTDRRVRSTGRGTGRRAGRLGGNAGNDGPLDGDGGGQHQPANQPCE